MGSRTTQVAQSDEENLNKRFNFIDDLTLPCQAHQHRQIDQESYSRKKGVKRSIGSQRNHQVVSIMQEYAKRAKQIPESEGQKNPRTRTPKKRKQEKTKSPISMHIAVINL
jgi:hypothetical protein